MVGCSVLPGFTRSVPDYLAVNGTAHAVMQLDAESGKHISIEDVCFRYVRHGSGRYNVPDDELLNGLGLGHAPDTFCAVNWLHVAVAPFGPTIVTSLFGCLGAKTQKPPFSVLM